MDTNTPTSSAVTPPATTSSPVLLVVVWLIVAVPALWGVSQTVMTSLKLFQATPAAAVTQPASAPATSP